MFNIILCLIKSVKGDFLFPTHIFCLSPLLQVSNKLPQVSWKTLADAMAACVKYMPRLTKNDEVVKFVQDCMFQILHVMISLNAIDGSPKTLTALQEMWKVYLKYITLYLVLSLINCLLYTGGEF